MLTATMLQSCFLLDVLPSEPQKKKKGVSKGQEPPPVEPVLPKPTRLAPERLMRRLSIDLEGRLPSQSDIDAILADANYFYVAADRMVDSGLAAINVAQMHRRMWELRTDRLPDMDGFISGGDSTLETKLTLAVREMITTEPLQFVRFHYENRLPFSRSFTADYSFGTSELIDLWDVTGSGSPWPAQNWTYTSYTDSRPAGGVLASNALLASIKNSAGSDQRNRGYALQRRFNCASMENKNAHLFYELTGDELLTDLGALALTKSACAGCHSKIENTAGVFQGFATGSSFSEWQNYSAPSSEFSGIYNGQAFTGMTEWVDAFSRDVQVHRCEAQKLLEAFLQRKYGEFDKSAVAIGLDAYFEDDENLAEIVRAIIRSESYLIDVVGPAIRGEHERQSSGVRTLRRHQWKNILTSLAPSIADLEFPEELDPGIDEILNSSDMIPTGLYWHSADMVARNAANRIVEEELFDTAIAVNRRVLTALPDGTAFNASTASINLQIKNTWKMLTSETVDDSNPTYLALQTLWTSAKPTSSEDAFKSAWRTVLTAMFTHPQFINY